MLALPGKVTIELAGEPQGKGRPRFVRATGHAFTPAATRKYESHLRMAAQDAMCGRAPFDSALKVRVLAAMPIPASWSRKKRTEAIVGNIRPCTTPDCDNLLKVLDALNEVVWRDDKQIVLATVAKVYSERPALTIEVEPIRPAPEPEEVPFS